MSPTFRDFIRFFFRFELQRLTPGLLSSAISVLHRFVAFVCFLPPSDITWDPHQSSAFSLFLPVAPVAALTLSTAWFQFSGEAIPPVTSTFNPPCRVPGDKDSKFVVFYLLL